MTRPVHRDADSATTASRVRLRAYHEPRDLWIGMYVKPVWYYRHLGGTSYKRELVGLQLYVCPLPTLVLELRWGWP